MKYLVQSNYILEMKYSPSWDYMNNNYLLYHEKYGLEAGFRTWKEGEAYILKSYGEFIRECEPWQFE